MTAFLFALIFCLSVQMKAQAVTFTEDFTNTTRLDSSELVWNFALGYLHPPLKVFGFQPPAQPVSSAIVSAGDGRDGPFEVSTYANFGTVVGNHITIDANTFPTLNVTRFHLDSTYTLSSVNGPLIIQSLSTVRIDGVIQCFGEAGNAAVGVLGGSGGSGRCGGFSGGAGGNAAASGTQGLPTSGTVTGGLGGIYNGIAPGAGGGGGSAYVGNDGGAGGNSEPATNSGGAGGSGVGGANHEFTILNGSPGGGGGSGSNTEGGGGGGGGGGTVIIHAVSSVTISSTGAILAYGGNGGSANTGGGGGGGGGGSVKIFTPANLELASGVSVDVTEGSGAIPILANAGDGGNGSFGRTWDISQTFSGAGSESHGSLLISTGTIGFSSGTTLLATSKSIDTGSDETTYQSFNLNPASGDSSLEIALSDDNFTIDDSGWMTPAAALALNQKRYFKFRVLLNNSNDLTATTVDNVIVQYSTPQAQQAFIQEFNFKSAGCGIIKSNQKMQRPFQVIVLFLLFFIPVLVNLFFLKQAQLQSSQLKSIRLKRFKTKY